MRMNSAIPMQVRSPDILNALMQGTETANAINEVQRTNALAQLYREQGAGIMNGDQNALAALAEYSPQEALGIQDARQVMDARSLGMDQTRLNMDLARNDDRRADARLEISREQLEIQRQAGARAAAQEARAMSAAEAGAEAARIERGMRAVAAAQTPEQFDQVVTSLGMEDLVGQFDNRAIIVAPYEGAYEVFQDAAGGNERYRAVGGDVYDWAPEGGGAPVQVSPQGGGSETVVMGPDGRPVYIQGPSGTVERFTESQSRDNVYSTRARGSLELLDQPIDGGGYLSDSLAGRGDRLLDVVPFGVGREFQASDFQVAQQAGREFLQAILRKDTGAAITAQEEALYGETYLPQPGDSPETLEAKRAARIRAVAAIEAGMSPAQMVARDQGLVRSEAEAAATANPRPSRGGPPATSPAASQRPPAQAVTDYATMSPDELLRQDTSTMTRAQIDAFNAALDALEAQ